VLNTVVANQLVAFKKDVDLLIEKGVKKDEAIFQKLKELIIDSKPIRFNGDGYSDDWVKEAARRGLTNVKMFPRHCRLTSAPKVKPCLKNWAFKRSRIKRQVEVEYENSS
jgi:glutamine synthetase